MTGSVLLVLRLFLALALYAFLVWALLVVWRELKLQSELAASRRVPRLAIIRETLEGPETYQFTAPEIRIGRDSVCDYQIDEKTVSAEHARLSYHHAQWWVEDLHSTNGTFLNQELVLHPVVLASGDELRCGQVVLILEIGSQNTQSQAEGLPANLNQMTKE
jgi:pSer/pThr/pTyr-binding forkhead associated (FHA) protein